MSSYKTKNITYIWGNICEHEGETFFTVAKKAPYTYVVKENYILVKNDFRRRIPKSYFEKALEIENPTPSKINLRGQSYICGIITDERIK